MQSLVKIAASFTVLAFLAAPLYIHAAVPTGFMPFGGRVTSSVPCISGIGPSLWVTIAPFGLPGTIPFSFIWTPLTLSSTIPPVPSIPPTHAGLQILGTYKPFGVMGCLIGKVPVYGWRMITENNSLPSGGF